MNNYQRRNMKDTYTHITLVVDRSGSMASIAADAQGGINQFVKDQKAVPGEATFYLADFDTEHQDVYGPADIQGFQSYVLVPRGGTALNDAIGKVIARTGEYLDKMAEAERPGKVIVCVVTDGGENSSREWTGGQVRRAVQEQESKYNWVFQFIGANIDSKSVGGGYGIQNTAQYQPTGASTRGVYANFSTTTANYRNHVGAGGQSVYAAASVPMSVDKDGNTVDEDGNIIGTSVSNSIP